MLPGKRAGGAPEAIPGPAPEHVEGAGLAIFAELAVGGDLPLGLLAEDGLPAVPGHAVGGDDLAADGLGPGLPIAELRGETVFLATGLMGRADAGENGDAEGSGWRHWYE